MIMTRQQEWYDIDYDDTDMGNGDDTFVDKTIRNKMIMVIGITVILMIVRVIIIMVILKTVVKDMIITVIVIMHVTKKM